MKSLVIVFLLFFLVPPGLAINTVNLVYRVDDRTIEKIQEAEGMWPLWNDGLPDDDLVHHFEGESIEGGTTNFVSTTASLEQAVRHAATLARPNSEEPYDEEFVTYIYQIRPSTNFYDLDASLISARDNAPNPSTSRDRLIRMVRDYTGMSEYVAHGGFLQSRIISYARLDGAMLARYFDSHVLFDPDFEGYRWTVNSQYNHDYDNDTTSSDIYRAAGNPRGIMNLIVNGTQPVVPLRFTCMATSSQHHSGRKKTPAPKPVCSANQYMNFKRNIYDVNIFGLFLQ